LLSFLGPVMIRKGWALVFVLSVLFFLPQGLSLELPDSGGEVVLSQNATLEIDPAQSVRMNGSLIVNGSEGQRVYAVIRNWGNLSIGDASFLCQDSDLLIENHGLLRGVSLSVSSLEGGNLTFDNEAIVDTVSTNLSAHGGGVLEFRNPGNFTVNQSQTSGIQGSSPAPLLHLDSVAGSMRIRNAGVLWCRNMNSACVDSGRTEIDSPGLLWVGNMNIHAGSSGKVSFVNAGNVSINNCNIQIYDAVFLLENRFDFWGNNMYFKSQYDGAGDSYGLTVRDLAELSINNLGMVSNGASGVLSLSCEGTTEINNANMDSNYGGNIDIRSEMGSDLHIGNANLDSSGWSHGAPSVITLEERGRTTIGNLNVNNNALVRMIHNGTGYIGNQYLYTRGSSPRTSIICGANYSSNNLHAETVGGSLGYEMAGGFLNNALFKTIDSDTLIRLSGLINNLMVTAEGAGGSVSMNLTGPMVNQLSLQAVSGGSINASARHASIGNMSLDVSGLDTDPESSIFITSARGSTVSTVEMDEGYEFSNMTEPGGPQNLLFRFEEGTIEMVSENSRIPVAEFGPQSLPMILSVILLARLPLGQVCNQRA